MCLLVNTYQSCCLFGHPIEQANAVGFETLLCDDAKAASNQADMCGNVSARNIPIFAHPYCTECDNIDTEMHNRILRNLEENATAHHLERLVTKEFVQDLRGLPIDRNRAPAVSREGILEYLRRGIQVPLSDTAAVRARVWVLAQRRKNNTRVVKPEVKRELFARWLIAACKARHIAVAMTIAKLEGDVNREKLLELLMTHTRLVSTYRARLTQLGGFEECLSLAGISESECTDGSSEGKPLPDSSDADFHTDDW